MNRVKHELFTNIYYVSKNKQFRHYDVIIRSYSQALFEQALPWQPKTIKIIFDTL